MARDHRTIASGRTRMRSWLLAWEQVVGSRMSARVRAENLMGWLLAGVLLAGPAWAQDEGEAADAAAPPAQATADEATAADNAPTPDEDAAGVPDGGDPQAADPAPPQPPRRTGVELHDYEPQLLALWRPLDKPLRPLPVAPLLPPQESPLLPPAPFAAPSVWSSQAYRLLPDKPLAAVRIYAPRPRAPIKETAFSAPRSCAPDPFTSTSTDDWLAQLRQGCGRDQLRLGVEGSRVELATLQPLQQTVLMDKPPASSKAPVKLELDQVQSQQWSALDTPLTTSVRLGWQGSRDGGLGQVQRDQRALLASGGLLRLGPDAALDMSVGRQRTGNLRSGEMRTRTAVTGLWRPLGAHMVYAQWADEATGIAREIGMRWWLQPGRLSLDLGARRSGDGQPLEPRLSLSMSGFLR
jgi:hypothetical protein